MSSLIVRDFIGSSAYGQVYRASWEGRMAAVKKFSVSQDAVLQSADIQREIDILKTLVNRHIIQFYGTDYHEGMFVLIMEYAEGGSLKRAIDGGRVTDWPTKKRIAQEIGHGLAYIHQSGVIHRDLNSMNVLLTRQMEVKLCDFGLATLKARSTFLTNTLKGTIRWMAPEVSAFRPEYSTKSDMYALGMVMWEMAANCTIPFQHLSSNEMVIRFVHAGEREQLPEDTPDDYRRWVKRCWAHDPLGRPEAIEMVVEGYVEALLALASDYENGIGVERDDSKAFQWYLRAAELHSTFAEVKTGDNFYHGRGTPKDLAASAYWRHRAAVKGHSEAQLKLGLMYERGQGVAQDYAEAVSWYRKSAEQGNVSALYNFGVMYEDGLGITQDYDEALWWYRKSAEQGNAVAQYNLGVMYDNGQGVVQDYAEALSWYRKSAEQGDATAQHRLGVMYVDGRGVAQDYTEALSWYRQSAEQGYAAAQRALGLMYENGRGVSQDYAEAQLCYRKSAEQGDATAQHRLGVMYEDGRGAAQDYVEASSWYRKSAQQGNATAQFCLGLMYEDGRGVAQDYAEALSWYRKSAEQGVAATYSCKETLYHNRTLYHDGSGVE